MEHTDFDLRPAGGRETKQFYAMSSEEDRRLGCIGHVRIDFGRTGGEFLHSWFPRGQEEWNSPAFRAELSSVVGELRKTVLSGLSGMRAFCAQNGGYMDGGWAPNFGYVIETDNYRYHLRCVPVPSDYNAYAETS